MSEQFGFDGSFRDVYVPEEHWLKLKSSKLCFIPSFAKLMGDKIKAVDLIEASKSFEKDSRLTFPIVADMAAGGAVTYNRAKGGVVALNTLLQSHGRPEQRLGMRSVVVAAFVMPQLPRRLDAHKRTVSDLAAAAGLPLKACEGAKDGFRVTFAFGNKVAEVINVWQLAAGKPVIAVDEMLRTGPRLGYKAVHIVTNDDKESVCSLNGYAHIPAPGEGHPWVHRPD